MIFEEEMFEAAKEVISDKINYQKWNHQVKLIIDLNQKINDWEVAATLFAGNFPFSDRLFLEKWKYGFIGQNYYMFCTSSGCEQIPIDSRLTQFNFVQGSTTLAAFKIYKYNK